MSIGVKICGLRDRDAMSAAIEAGASHYGLVFFGRSSRNVTLDEAAGLATFARGRITSVALTVDADNALIDRIAAGVRPDMLQLHGNETPERVVEIRSATGLPIIKAISVDGPGDTSRARSYEDVADLILFDAKAPKATADALPGGNGLTFDWRLLEPVRGKLRFMLSGGLTPDNVAEAIRLTGAEMVDVSSGVESAPGWKDPALIRRFIEAAQASVLEEVAHG